MDKREDLVPMDGPYIQLDDYGTTQPIIQFLDPYDSTDLSGYLGWLRSLPKAERKRRGFHGELAW